MLAYQESFICRPVEGESPVLEVLPPTQAPFEITGEVFIPQAHHDVQTPLDGNDTRGKILTRYTNGPDTLYLMNSGVGQEGLEAMAKTVWSQQRKLGELSMEARVRLRGAWKDHTHVLHDRADAFAGNFFRQEELRWEFDEATLAGNDGRVPQRSLAGFDNGRDSLDVNRMVEQAWDQVVRDGEEQAKRLAQRRIQATAYPYTEAAKS